MRYINPRFTYFTYLLTFCDKDELVSFWGRRVKGQGYIIATEVSSTRRRRRVLLSSFECGHFVSVSTGI